MNIETIWGAYRTQLRAFVQQRLANSADVDDVLQEVLIKSHAKLSTLNEEHNIGAWLYQITNNTLIDFYRARHSLDTYSAVHALYSEPEENLKAELSRCIEPFLNALPQAQSALLRAVDLEGQSQKAVAAELGLPYSTLKSQVQKSRDALRHLFGQCCHYALDHRGNLIDYQRWDKQCPDCPSE
ncbi:MAG: RNA polymerase sigma factor SigZ [Pseudomonadales bacterium]